MVREKLEKNQLFRERKRVGLAKQTKRSSQIQQNLLIFLHLTVTFSLKYLMLEHSRWNG
jgi:ABC-type molybdate transport system ATPase subunit